MGASFRRQTARALFSARTPLASGSTRPGSIIKGGVTRSGGEGVVLGVVPVPAAVARRARRVEPVERARPRGSNPRRRLRAVARAAAAAVGPALAVRGPPALAAAACHAAAAARAKVKERCAVHHIRA